MSMSVCLLCVSAVLSANPDQKPPIAVRTMVWDAPTEKTAKRGPPEHLCHVLIRNDGPYLMELPNFLPSYNLAENVAGRREFGGWHYDGGKPTYPGPGYSKILPGKIHVLTFEVHGDGECELSFRVDVHVGNETTVYDVTASLDLGAARVNQDGAVVRLVPEETKKPSATANTREIKSGALRQKELRASVGAKGKLLPQRSTRWLRPRRS